MIIASNGSGATSAGPISTCTNLPVGLVNANYSTVGVASCSATISSGTGGGAAYTIGITVSNYYVNGAADDTVISVAQPYSSNFITGGGYLINTSNSSGLYPGAAGQKTNFGFFVKYNKSGTNLQGNMNIIVRNGGRVYQIKGTPISIDGNATLQVTMTDKGERGLNDAIGMTVYNKFGGVWFSSYWSGTKTFEQLLTGGNLAAH